MITRRCCCGLWLSLLLAVLWQSSPVSALFDQLTVSEELLKRSPLERRWPGWATATTYTTIYVSGASPGTETAVGTLPAGPQTVTETVYPSGQSPSVTVPGTVTVTIFDGAPTPGPQSLVTTTVTITPGGGGSRTTTTVTSTSSRGTALPQQTGSGDGPCYEGEADQIVPGRRQLVPTPSQQATYYVIAIYFVVLFVCWNLFLLRHVIYPVKLVIVSWHELGHAIGIVLSGRHIESATIDPNEGGMVVPVGGIHAYPLPALPWGFVFSIMIGGALTFCAFDTLASKIASFFVGISLAAVIYFGRGVATKLLVLVAIAYALMMFYRALLKKNRLLIGFWFIDHAGVLRYYILFYGVASSWYGIWDTMDDYVFRKPNPSCAALHNRNIPRISSATFAIVWLLVSLLIFIGWILAGTAVFRQTSRAMFCQSQMFLPT